MLVFIDESGTHKQDGHSSVALAYVFVKDADKLNSAVCELESRLNMPGFHWSKYNWKIRYEFLKSLLPMDFTVKATLLKNPFSEEVFEAAIRELLTEKEIKSIIIDGRKPIRYVLRLKKVLREYHISPKKIRMGNDMAFPGLRIADAFAGLVRSADEKGNIKAKQLFKVMKIKIATL